MRKIKKAVGYVDIFNREFSTKLQQKIIEDYCIDNDFELIKYFEDKETQQEKYNALEAAKNMSTKDIFLIVATTSCLNISDKEAIMLIEDLKIQESGLFIASNGMNSIDSFRKFSLGIILIHQHFEKEYKLEMERKYNDI